MIFDKIAFAHALNAELANRGWSQAELARRSGMTIGQISRYMNGRLCPTAPTIKALADALEIEPAVLVYMAVARSNNNPPPRAARRTGGDVGGGAAPD